MLAVKSGDDKIYPVKTGIFLRITIARHKDHVDFSYWRVVYGKHLAAAKKALIKIKLKIFT